MIEGFDSLDDERCEYVGLLGVGHLPVNAGRKDDADLMRRRAVRYEASDEQVHYLSAAGLSRSVRNDDKDRLPSVDDILERRRIDREIEFRADLRIGKSCSWVITAAKDLKAFGLEF